MPVYRTKPVYTTKNFDSGSIPKRVQTAIDADADLPICVTCGTQYPAPRDDCPICLDPRQYVAGTGQAWTTLRQALKSPYRNPDWTGLETFESWPILGLGDPFGGRGHRYPRSSHDSSSGAPHKNGLLIDEEDQRVRLITTTPSFGIGQTPILIDTADGAFIWDTSAILTPGLAAHLSELPRPLKGIAISHPHFFTTSLTWCRTLDVPLYLNEHDKEWYQRACDITPNDKIVWWRKELSLSDTVTLIECGGHFPGSSVLHWNRGAEPQSERTASWPKTGLILTADTLMVQQSQAGFTFMWSYPNAIPLPPPDVVHIQDVLAKYEFEVASSTWPYRMIRSDAKKVLEDSVKVYLRQTGWRLEKGSKLVAVVDENGAWGSS